MPDITEGPGPYRFPIMKRGDTFRARNIATITQAGLPLAVTAAHLQVRAKNGGAVLLEWLTADNTITITGAGSNVVRLSAKTSGQMKLIPPGTHDYDLEVKFASDGADITILKGQFPVEADVTRTI